MAERKDIEEILYWKAAASYSADHVESNRQPELDFGGQNGESGQE